MLQNKTGAEVAVQIKYNGHPYNYPPKRPGCTCSCSCGSSTTSTPQSSTTTPQSSTTTPQSSITTPQSLTTTPSTPHNSSKMIKLGTPKSVNRKRLRLPCQEPMVVEKMPGKRGAVKKPPSNRVTGKCMVCKRVYESREDQKFRKGKMRKTTWVGCEKKGCKYWVHAECGGLDIGPKDNIKNLPFFCFQHRQ